MADIRQEILAGRLRDEEKKSEQYRIEADRLDAKVKALEAALEFEKQAKIAGLNTRPISLLEERDAHIETMVKSFWELFWQNYGSCATACALLGGFGVRKNFELTSDPGYAWVVDGGLTLGVEIKFEVFHPSVNYRPQDCYCSACVSFRNACEYQAKQWIESHRGDQSSSKT